MNELIMECMNTKHGSYIFIGLLLLMSTPTYSDSIEWSSLSCHKNPIFCHVLTLRPNIDKTWAYKFSNLLYKYGKKFKMDPMRSLAIAMQETSLKNQHRSRNVLVFFDNCDKEHCVKAYKEIKGFSDLGIFQFHVKTIKHFHINPIKLNESLEYTVSTHFELLKHKQKQCEHLKENAWACYHSKTAKYRNKYISMVNRWYPKRKTSKSAEPLNRQVSPAPLKQLKKEIS